jgi:hypothetical protein
VYSINGVSLHDPARGWRILRSGTSTQGGITNSINRVAAPGRNGYIPAPSTFTEQVIVFNVRATRASLESLLMLASVASTLRRTDDPTKEARVELASAIPTGEAPLDGTFDVTITLSAFEGVWRDSVTVVVGPTGVTSPSQAFNILDGISAPMTDMNLFLRGVFGQFTLTDSGGSSIKTTRGWPGSSSIGLLYVGATGQAFFANESSPFVPTSDASQYIDVSGNGGFRMTPKMVSGNPSVRRVELSLTTLTQTSTTLRVQAKRAYRMN